MSWREVPLGGGHDRVWGSCGMDVIVLSKLVTKLAWCCRRVYALILRRSSSPCWSVR